MTRINYAGESHKCKKFAVLGGMGRLGRGKISLRKKALAILRGAYASKKLPGKKEAEELARKVLGLEMGRGEIITDTLEMDTVANIRKIKKK